MSERLPTGWICHERYFWHEPGKLAGIAPHGYELQPGESMDNAEVKRRIRNLVEYSGLLKSLLPIDPYSATETDILRVHTPAYVERIRAMSAHEGGDAGGNSYIGTGGYEIALLAAGGVMAAVDAVIGGRVRNAYALVRPIGHHAIPDSGLGFCVFNNGAVAARHAQVRHGVKRIAFVDWDVHHGNGAEAIFWDDPDVLTISIHQERIYPPDSGDVEAIGGPAARGRNLNIPLPGGSGWPAYERAFRQVVLPALHAFQPELVMVPCGYDAGWMDPLARQMLHSDAFRGMTAMVMEAADALCGGRIVMCQEGGYSHCSVPFYGLAVLEQLSGIRSGVEDPHLKFIGAMGGQQLRPHQQEYIDAAAANLRHLGI